MKQCLNCQKEFEPKRNSAKYCSTSCRVSYNKQGSQESVGLSEMRLILNKVIELLDMNRELIRRYITHETGNPREQSIDESKLNLILAVEECSDLPKTEEKTAPPKLANPSLANKQPVPGSSPAALNAIIRSYKASKPAVNDKDGYNLWFEKLQADNRLTEQQKKDILTDK